MNPICKQHHESVPAICRTKLQRDSYPALIGTEWLRSLSLIEPLCAVAQADNVESSDFVGASSKTQQSTTVFHEAAAEVIGTTSKPTLAVSTYVEQLADIKSFLSKPYLLANGQWTTSQAINTNLANSSIGGYLTSIDVWAEKIKGFNLMKGDFILRVEINASPFQQGKLMLHYLPCYANFVAVNAKFGSRTNLQLIQKAQHPHVEIDCRKTAVAFRIPYIAPSHFYGINEAKYDWGTWFLDVYSALLTGTAAPSGQDYVDYLVYGYWENVELAAPIVPQSSNREVRRKNKVNEAEENKGPIEEGLRKVGKTADLLDGVPVLSEFAGAVSWASDIAANIAHIWGWSKPRELTGVQVLTEQMARYAGTADGPDLALPGGMICNNRIQTIDYGSFTNEDEMSLRYLLKIPTYLQELTWTAGAGQGARLLNLNVNPANFRTTQTDTVGAHTATYMLSAPLAYLSQFFELWRGGIEITLKFVKTQMHSGRLQLCWTPITSVGTTPSLTTSAYSLRSIVDIRTEDEVTVVLPYLAFTDYLSINGGIGAPFSSGHLTIDVLNDVRAPESCAQSVAIQVFVRAGDDFEFAVPGNSQNAILPHIPQSNNTEVVHGRDSGMVLTDEVIGGMSTTDDVVFHSSRCVGEKCMSVKQLLLRNTPLSTIGSSLIWSDGSTFNFYPHFLGATSQVVSTGTLSSTNLGGDMLSFIAPMYAFMRGSVKIMMRNTHDASPANSTFRTMFGNFPGFFPFNAAQPYVLDNTVLSNLQSSTGLNPLTGTANIFCVQPGNWTTDSDTVFQHIPYYNRLPLTPTYQYQGVEVPADPAMPVGTLAVVQNGAFEAPVVQRAVGDDFQCTFFIGCPPVLIGYT